MTLHRRAHRFFLFTSAYIQRASKRCVFPYKYFENELNTKNSSQLNFPLRESSHHVLRRVRQRRRNTGQTDARERRTRDYGTITTLFSLFFSLSLSLMLFLCVFFIRKIRSLKMVQKSRQVERRFTRDYERDHFHHRRSRYNNIIIINITR